ncbi:hypothetical protein VNO80_14214 [Phaseolus coccineus]|uniref:Uncharacterized protein n=1 Tax=Phaseolus coccineus TaxID=3886 RepID=A0AAN9MLF6_PHACN
MSLPTHIQMQKHWKPQEVTSLSAIRKSPPKNMHTSIGQMGEGVASAQAASTASVQEPEGKFHTDTESPSQDTALHSYLRGQQLSRQPSLKERSLILKLMTNERNPSSRVSEKRLRFIFTQERDRREEPHPGCIISICIKRPRLSGQTDTELPCQDSSSY